ncbi:unnamed protein product [Parnassius apollo]|uniref:(apollo) hypothetical protein n=1 Tax=Parnassius apollo TaxID=110799 RepID=A0A8S3WTR0_PARAO|nr:unnamed protein product [Parnassius apollo]
MMELIDFFSTFMTADMIRNIVGHTNEEIVLRSSKYKEQTATISSTCEEELTALLGLLLLSAAKKDNHLTSLELFDPTFSGTRYISLVRERDIIQCQCKDDNTLCVTEEASFRDTSVSVSEDVSQRRQTIISFRIRNAAFLVTQHTESTGTKKMAPQWIYLLKKPSLDTCNTCDSYKMKIKLALPSDIENPKQELEAHQIQADSAYAIKKERQGGMYRCEKGDWYNLVRLTSSNIIVIIMRNDMFLDFASLYKGPLQLRKVDSSGEKFIWHDVKWFRYSGENESGTIQFKTSIDSPEFENISFSRRGKANEP